MINWFKSLFKKKNKRTIPIQLNGKVIGYLNDYDEESVNNLNMRDVKVVSIPNRIVNLVYPPH